MPTPLENYLEPDDVEGPAIMTMTVFKACVAAGGYTDDDGYGYGVENGMVYARVLVIPSELDEIPSSIDHVIWFNK